MILYSQGLSRGKDALFLRFLWKRDGKSISLQNTFFVLILLNIVLLCVRIRTKRRCFERLFYEKIIVLVLAFLFLLCGCSSYSKQQEFVLDDASYDVGYEKGYDEGYSEALEKALNKPDYLEDFQDFQAMISDLMYDHEYDTVKLLLKYKPKYVEAELEDEFGTKDLSSIIDYLEELAKTVEGNCEVCGKTVYADEYFIPNDEYKCAHWVCINGNNGSEVIITKKK